MRKNGLLAKIRYKKFIKYKFDESVKNKDLIKSDIFK